MTKALLIAGLLLSQVANAETLKGTTYEVPAGVEVVTCRVTNSQLCYTQGQETDLTVSAYVCRVLKASNKDCRNYYIARQLYTFNDGIPVTILVELKPVPTHAE